MIELTYNELYFIIAFCILLFTSQLVAAGDIKIDEPKGSLAMLVVMCCLFWPLTIAIGIVFNIVRRMR